jgi:MFS family permease
VLLGAVLFMAGYMSLNALMPGTVTKLSEKDTRGAVTGIYNTIQYIGSFAGGSLTGLLWGINKQLPIALIIVVSAFGCILVRNLESPDGRLSAEQMKVAEQSGTDA